jgi:hypothetical protein
MTDEQREGTIAALLEERRGLVQRGLTSRVAQVDAELKRLGAGAETGQRKAARRETHPRGKAKRGGDGS